MALTKNVIFEQIQAGLGFPKNQSVEITESLLEIIKSNCHPVTMFWFPVLASSVSGTKRNGKDGTRPQVRI
jgi:hypothetical protein